MLEIEHSKILITGGAGFIGSNLAEALIGKNEIVVVDDLSMGKLENLPNSTNLHFYRHSICDQAFMSNLLMEWDFDYIFLLAAVASVADTIKRPLETHEVNQEANIHILDVVRKKRLNIKRLLFTSSAAVYGNDPELPKTETSVIDPLTPYAIDKFSTERFVLDYGRLYGIPTVATRFFNVYGPKQNPDSPYSGVLSLISNSIKGDTRFTVFGDGNQTRDFVYIDDVISALKKLVTSKKSLYEVYNVATAIPTTLNDVIRIFNSISGKKLNVGYEDPRMGDIRNSYADISKLETLGYKPGYDIEMGLKEYWQYIK